MTKLLHSYVEPMIKANIDYLVLGCSHYPYLIPQLRKIVPDHIKIIDSGEAVAKQTQSVLKEKVGLHESGVGKPLFYTNGNTIILSEILCNKYQINEEDF
jgi:glutamate racemase